MKKLLHELDGKHQIYQFDDGFSFGTDAVLLSGFIRCRKGQIGAELGTGTGIIPLLLSLHKDFKQIFALEIQEDYARLAEENIAMNGFSEKVSIVTGDLKNAASLIPAPCDFVFSNPPYMKADSGFLNESEGKCVARHEIHCRIEDVCRAASSLLQDKGEFFCVYRIDRLCDLFVALRNNLLEPKNIVFVTPTKDKAPLLILVRAVKGAKSALKTRASFVLTDENQNRTEEAALLYERGILKY